MMMSAFSLHLNGRLERLRPLLPAAHCQLPAITPSTDIASSSARRFSDFPISPSDFIWILVFGFSLRSNSSPPSAHSPPKLHVVDPGTSAPIPSPPPTRHI